MESRVHASTTTTSVVRQSSRCSVPPTAVGLHTLGTFTTSLVVQLEVHLSVPGIGKSYLPTLALMQVALDFLRTYSVDRIHVYTDGYTNRTSSTGAVVSP